MSQDVSPSDADRARALSRNTRFGQRLRLTCTVRAISSALKRASLSVRA